MIIVNKNEMKKTDGNSLLKEAVSLKKELFNLRLGVSSGQIKDFSQFKKTRCKIAQALTFAKQNEQKTESKK